MRNLSFFDPAIVVPAATPTAGRTPFWQGRRFVLTLGVQFRYAMQPEMHEGDATYRVGPVGDSTFTSASLWKNLDFEVIDNGRVVRPKDPVAASVHVTAGDMGVLGYPPKDTYNEVTFFGANTPGDYILFVDALVGALVFSPNFYMVVNVAANLTVDDTEVWSRTYGISGPLGEQSFTDEHKLALR